MSELYYFFLVLIPSAIFHEYMHGYVADQLGDPTARYAGRLTLNPIVHIDLWGTVLLPMLLYFGSGGQFVFAYAKPVPYNPYNLKNQRTGPMWVAIAGPLSNFFLAAGFAVIFRLLPISQSVREILLSKSLTEALKYLSNHPLTTIDNFAIFTLIIILANVVLGVFNLVPIPPLDGSKVLYALLPNSLDGLKNLLDRYGFVILLVFVFYFFPILEPVIQTVYRFFIGA